MGREKKLNTKFLIFKPNVFVERQLRKAKKRKMISKYVYYAFNIIAMISSFFVVSLTTIIFSRIWTKTTPEWFFYTTTSISAITAFIVSVTNFFYVKEMLNKYTRQVHYIETQIAFFVLGLKEYKSKRDKEFNLFHNVCSFIDINLAKESENEK
ncbi:DUF4231 domain-containing protein [Candidatus Mycoplasma mahonii]|uniref:DUF4231 domain-containing protein n=1 Tax=Candidatus Mycoplasma mahonii TaxID=3004105 RepID=UPI0026EA9773|nr:DUF4231 domain-containing protein [Candidatus Mycoplasma mahonii]WKX02812.1 DUF4231 domain-containing protein [Candidatus Mycoplasma mahonii]